MCSPGQSVQVLYVDQNYETLASYCKTISKLADATYTFLETEIKSLGFSASATPKHHGAL